jgi:hypothetical protein
VEGGLLPLRIARRSRSTHVNRETLPRGEEILMIKF